MHQQNEDDRANQDDHETQADFHVLNDFLLRYTVTLFVRRSINENICWVPVGRYEAERIALDIKIGR
jgi:hypothetical protein